MKSVQEPKQEFRQKRDSTGDWRHHMLKLSADKTGKNRDHAETRGRQSLAEVSSCSASLL